jgi:DNA-binding Lrp family transcriptional regulator
MEELKPTDYRLLFELMKDSHRSYRELAKVLKISQPTVTRTRNRLVQEGLIQELTVIPNLLKLGFEIMAVTCFKARPSKELDRSIEVIPAILAPPDPTTISQALKSV